MKFDLALDATEHAEGLRLTFAYNRDLFDAATIVRMGEHLKTLMRGVVADPDAKIETLPLLSEGERKQLLFELNGTAVEYPREICLHELFEAQVARSPEAVALTAGDTRLTYRELNERANRLAHYLRARGVGPDTLVGLCLERSPEMVTAILGVLKAGGAYVPFDPAQPQERLDYMIERRLAGAPAHAVVAARPPGRCIGSRCSSSTRRTTRSGTTPRVTPTRRRSGSATPTWPTSSTPRARPAGPRA